MIRLALFLFVLCALGAVPGAAQTGAAQTAAEHYHAAAQHYIAEDDAEAERAALAGLALAPDDRKLQALLDRIREEREPQSGRQQNRDDADEQQAGSGAPQQDRDESGEPQPSDDGEPEEPAQTDEQQHGDPQPETLQPEEPSDAQPEDERDAGSAGEPDDGSPDGDGTASPHDVEPGTMSRAEAERILRAIEADELELLRDVQHRRSRPRYVEKDW